MGASLALKVKVACVSGCDLRGQSVQVMAADGVVIASELVDYSEKKNETGEFTFLAPKQAGEHGWSVAFPGHETDNLIHEKTSVPISLRTIPHKTSLTVWDVPAPVVTNGSFRAKVAVKCSARCQLAGQLVEIRDETETKVGKCKLGETPWQGTDALYWGDAEILAPATPGVFFWTGKFTGADLELAHEEASTNFSFRADKPPEHRVTIKVIAEDTRAPVGNAEVRLGFYFALTDESGLATFDLPKGAHELRIRTDGYKGPPMTVEVAEDVTIQVEALKTLTEAEIEERARRIEAASWG